MMVVALIMRPWILEMRRLGAKGRVLADDILVTVTGGDHCRFFKVAYDETHRYLHRMGAKLAPRKSFTPLWSARPCPCPKLLYRSCSNRVRSVAWTQA